ncbi:MAG: hypothetical protein Q8P15_03490 [Nanoarchaeota archaeon]|nr:hypothetical protein [Nanoarchaeota archaeon]
MEYVEGQTYAELCAESKLGTRWLEKIMEMADKERDKARKIGLIPKDSEHEKNIIWSWEQNKIFLIDFAWWKYKH